MDQKQQVIMHATSHGERAQVNSVQQSNNSFSNLVISPITGVNKVGLLYAAIPKLFDTVQGGNNSFIMYLTFPARNLTAAQLPDNYNFIQRGYDWVAELKITLPLIAYTGSRRSIVIDEQQQREDDGEISDPDSGSPNRANLAEILMLRINNALEKYDDGTPEGAELQKYGCIVRTDALGRF